MRIVRPIGIGVMTQTLINIGLTSDQDIQVDCEGGREKLVNGKLEKRKEIVSCENYI